MPNVPTITTDCPCAPGSMNIHLAGFPTKEPYVTLMVWDPAPGSLGRGESFYLNADGTYDYHWTEAVIPGEYLLKVFQVRGRKTNYQLAASATATVA